MSQNGFEFVYGPVPSRRLGRSLGIDFVPFKTCTYDCVYCQLGRTTNLTGERKEYVSVARVLEELKEKLAGNDQPDVISLAGSGEPTLNSGIGDLIEGIRNLTSIPLVVLTNGSLLWDRDVQNALVKATKVLPSLDAGDDALFSRVNRPHSLIEFDKMVEGLVDFSGRFSGEMWLEVLLLANSTGTKEHAEKIAALVKRINPDRVQLNTVVRPPAEKSAMALLPEKMEQIQKLFSVPTEVICNFQPEKGQAPILSEARTEDVLALLSRRPCTCQDVAAGLGIVPNEALKYLEKLMKQGRVSTSVNQDKRFYAATVSQ